MTPGPTVPEPTPAGRAAELDHPVSWEPAAAFVKYTVATLLLSALAYLLVIRIVAPEQTGRMVGPVLTALVAAGAGVLLWRGKAHAAVKVLAIGAWLAATGISVFYGGVRTPIFIAYPLIIVMTGWLIGPGAALVAAAATLAAVAAFVTAEAWDLLPAAPATLPAMHAVVQVAIVALSTILIVFLVRSYRSRLGELHRIGGDLARRSQDLEASKAELHRAQAVAKVGSWSFEIAADRMALSAETCRIFGLPEGTGGSHAAYLSRTHEPDRQALEAAWAAALAGAPFDHEHRIVVRDEVRWVRQMAVLEFAADGTARHAVGVTQDVTDRKRAELAVRATTQRLQATLNAIPDLLFEVDSQGRIFDAHTHRADLLAAPREQFLGRLMTEIVPESAAQAIQSSLDEAAVSGWSMGTEYALPLPQGERWFELSVAPMAASEEADRHFIAIARDVTERKHAEQALQLSASVFTHAREGIMIAAASGAIIDVNAAFTRITGYEREEVIGRNPRLLSSGRQDRDFYAALWRHLREDGHWYGEIWNRRKDGGVFAGMQTISAVRDADGNVRNYVSLLSDISALKAHEAQLEHIAHFDALTNLPNRVLLSDRLHQAMAQAQRRSQRLAVVFLDLDGFKLINDQHGHEAGDVYLIEVASRMKQTLRDGDTLARIGGDEFVAVLVDLHDVEASSPMLERLLGAVSEPVRSAQGLLQASASLGVTFFPQAQAVDADQLLRQADQAMYQAKLAGKSRYHLFDAEHDSSVRSRHADLEQLRLALTRREFVLRYQPKVNMRTGQVIGAEALIRWDHPQRGLLLPAEFLSTVEDHPLGIEIGEWVIETVLRQIGAWQAEGLDLPVSVNLGAAQLQQADFVERLEAQLRAHPQVKASNLELEVLETSALADVNRVSQVIEACAKFGVMFALDDFGTGYSSLTYLKRLPVAQLKIDRSFVHDMLDDPDDLAILEGVIGLAGAFRRQVLAEGVETSDHGVLLLQLGCELAQGNGIARPMPASDLPAWVAGWRTDPGWLHRPSVDRGQRALLFAHVELRAWLARTEAALRDPAAVPAQPELDLSRLGPGLDSAVQDAGSMQTPAVSLKASINRFRTVAAGLVQLQRQGHGAQVQASLGELHDLLRAMREQMTAPTQEDRHDSAAGA